jgi:teichuronic acid biosynthesis protein TuaE
MRRNLDFGWITSKEVISPLLIIFISILIMLAGLAWTRSPLWLLTPILATAVACTLLLLTRNRRWLPSGSEVLRWGFLIMLPAATVGSVAAWPSFRGLSLFRVLYIGLCFGGVTWFLLKRRLPADSRVGRYIIFLGFWVACSLASLLWAVDRPEGLRYLIFLTMMTSLTFGSILAINRVSAMRIALGLLLVTFLLSLGIALLEIETDFRLPTSGLSGMPERYQWASTSFFHNQNDFATYIALWFPFLAMATFCTRRVGVLVAAIIAAFLSVICLLYTASRSNLLALGLTILCLLVIVVLRRKTIAPWQMALGIAVLFALAAELILGIQGLLPVFRLPDIGVQHWGFGTLGDEISTETGSGGSRVALIVNGLRVLLDSHLLGVGPGNAEYHLQRMPGTETVYNPHNWWMEVLVNGGIFVFAGYVIFYAGLLFNLFRIAVSEKDQNVAYVAAAILLALVGYTLGSLAPSSAIHFTPMWIHFGLGLAVINIHRKRVADAER